MTLSYYSFLMAITWFSVFILVGDFLRKKTGFLLYYSVGVLLVLIGLSILRLFLPIEFPFTMVLHSEDIFPVIQAVLTYPILTLQGFSITIITPFVAVWAVGSLRFLVQLIRRLKQDSMVLDTYYEVEDERARRYLEEIVASTKPGQQYRLIVSPEIAAPAVVGFWRPTILLPKTNLDDESLQYFVAHEWRHFLNRDQWIKLLVDLLHCALWWNPVLQPLRDNLFQVLEIRCDLGVTRHLDELKKQNYLLAIVNALECTNEANDPVRGVTQGFWMAGATTKDEAVKQRFEMINKYQHDIKRDTVVFVAAVLFAFILSYFVVVQPYYPPPADNVTLSANAGTERFYIIAHGDGSYSMMSEGVFVDSIAPEDLSKPPYNALTIIEE